MLTRKATVAPVRPKASVKIWRTGTPVGVPRTLSKSPMQKRSVMIHKNPTTPTMAVPPKMARGARRPASCASSQR